jgi:hypothetical protein
MQQMSHEKLEVYQKAVEFFALAVELIDSITDFIKQSSNNFAELRFQLFSIRKSGSIIPNH